MLPQLCDQFTVTAIDMPGHGMSPPLEMDNPSLADYSGVISRMLATQSRPVFIAGHSMGALLAVDLAIRHPEQIVGVCALNMIFRRTPEAAKAVADRASSLAVDRIADPGPTLERWFTKNCEGDLLDASMACRKWLMAMDPKAYRQAYRVFASEDGPTDTALQNMAPPGLFITGALEPNSTPQMSKALAALAQNGQYSIVEGAAHMMPMTHGAQVAETMISFMMTNSNTAKASSDGN
jgi:pimeloyl-ACP methyl ester carboxylesterase